MPTKSTKTILIASVMAVVAMSAITSLPAEGNTEITRQVTDEEFRQTQIHVLDLRSELNRLEAQSAQGADTSAEKRSVDAQIAQLMPILDKHQEQQFAKHYIEPVRKAQLEQTESSLRNSISELGFGSYAVNLNTETKTIEVITSDSSKNTQVRELFDSYPSDTPIALENGEFTVIDNVCSSQTSDCDPIVGGIEVEGSCTLGLPVRKGFWPFYTYGFITAGHCISDGQDLNQPNESSPEIGDDADSKYVGDCDCAWVPKTTSTTSKSEIWRSPNNYITVYNEASARPADGINIVVSAKNSGFLFGNVVDGSFTIYADGIQWDLVRHNIALVRGDSGAPIGDADASDILAIVKGDITAGSNVYHVATAWEEIDKDFSVSLHQ